MAVARVAGVADLLGGCLAGRRARFPTPGRAHPEARFCAPARCPLWVGDKGAPMSSHQQAWLVERAYRAAGITARLHPGPPAPGQPGTEPPAGT